ncbi:IS66 Orf2 like protein [Syntrophus gentianae]|uniref:IS66 Orf2 like protein n=1 Tax=Syntrophus gentianae TaxID=43775 RepID=A0A1H8BED6_9BACT|nr:IS66 family insertion sequence element accessory protein TnpB [Syntrophus gentianae]SEM80809.1 IS66 Orf2 like protein [Syntrophus gentianae]
MFGLMAATRIYLYRGRCDMRKSFDGLCGIIPAELGADPLSGSLFVFVNRRRSMVKLLYWNRDGLALWYKRLERGCFILPERWTEDGLIERHDLTTLLEGIVPNKMEKDTS